jgi:predicted CopG family antitoxin
MAYTNITVNDAAYELLCSLKGKKDSFSNVILRHIKRPAETCGELLEAMEKAGPPEVDLEMLDRMEAERGRRSGGRK